MKVLHVIDSLGLGGGAEHALVAQLPLLRARGVHGHVVCLRAREGGLQQVLVDAGFPVQILSSSNTFGRARELRSIVDRVRPDVVHATLFDSCLASRLALVGRCEPLVNSIVNLTYDEVRTSQLGRSRWKAAVAQAIDMVTIRRVDKIHALTEAVVADSGRALHLHRDRFTVIPRGRARVSPLLRRTWREKVREELGVSDHVPVVIAVGRQDVQKDQLNLVKAFRAVSKVHMDAQLWLMGRSGTQTPDIESALGLLGLGGNVRLLGHRDDAIQIIAAADLFALPSLYEGLGSVVLEAMSVGVPVVVSDTPALVEVTGGTAAAVVPTGGVSALQDALIELVDDSERRASTGKAGEHRFDHSFTLEVVADSTIAMYRTMLSRQR